MQIAINYYAGKVENARDNYKVQLHIFFFNYNINYTAYGHMPTTCTVTLKSP